MRDGEIVICEVATKDTVSDVNTRPLPQAEVQSIAEKVANVSQCPVSITVQWSAKGIYQVLPERQMYLEGGRPLGLLWVDTNTSTKEGGCEIRSRF